MEKPVYVRSPEHLYPVRADPPHPRFTGRSPAGLQALVISETLLEFDPAGQLLGVRDYREDDGPPAGFEAGPIAVRRFWLPERRLGISDIPVGLLGLPGDPELFTAENWDLVRSSEFIQWGNFALRCGCVCDGLGHLFIGRDGECLLHSV